MHIFSRIFFRIFFHGFSFDDSFADFLSMILLRIFLKAMKACLFLLKGDFRSNILLGFSVETSFADLKKKIFSTIFLERKSAKESMKRKSCTINMYHIYIIFALIFTYLCSLLRSRQISSGFSLLLLDSINRDIKLVIKGGGSLIDKGIKAFIAISEVRHKESPSTDFLYGPA